MALNEGVHAERMMLYIKYAKKLCVDLFELNVL